MLKRHAHQSLLLDTQTQLPNGLIYKPEFISEEEEEILLAYLQNLPLRSPRHLVPLQDVRGDNPVSYHSKRRSKGFGWGWDEERERFVPGLPLPPFMRLLQRKIAKWLDIPPARVAEALVNEYAPGAAIGWHRDNEPFEVIAGVSLAGWCTMQFRPFADKEEVVSLDVEPRSLYLMQGPVRWRWQHSVAPVSTLRYSITLRTLPPGVLR